MNVLRILNKSFAVLCLTVPCFCWHSVVFANDDDYYELLKNVSDLGLPVLCVETVNQERPTYDVNYPPEGEGGISIINATKVPGRLVLLEHGDTVYDSGEYDKGLSGMTIKVRGNGSALKSVKPYKIKLQKKSDLLLRGNDEVYADKEWLLIRDGYKRLLTLCGLKVNELVHGSWTPAHQYVVVLMNGSYEGIYMLIESVKRNPLCRMDVDKSGFIIECDNYWWNEDIYFTSDNGLKYTFKYPDDDDMTVQKVEFVNGAVNKMEQSFSDDTYPEYIDVGSFASWVLGHDIHGTQDGKGSNIYLMKYDSTDNSRFKMGCMWDYDVDIDHYKADFSEIHNASWFYFTKLFRSSCNDFLTSYLQQWDDFLNGGVQNLMLFLTDYPDSEEGKALQKARDFESDKWGVNYMTVAENIEREKKWYSYRVDYLKNAIPKLTSELSCLYDCHITPARNTFYKLYGYKADTRSHGIMIENGRKGVKKGN